MTIGNLEALVADVTAGDSGVHKAASESGTAKKARTSGTHKRVRASSGPHRSGRKTGSRKRLPTASRPRTRTTGSRAVTSARPRVNTLNTGALETPMAGDAFGRGVMTEQQRGVSPLIWMAVVVILGVIGYFAWTIMNTK